MGLPCGRQDEETSKQGGEKWTEEGIECKGEAAQEQERCKKGDHFIYCCKPMDDFLPILPLLSILLESPGLLYTSSSAKRYLPGSQKGERKMSWTMIYELSP